MLWRAAARQTRSCLVSGSAAKGEALEDVRGVVRGGGGGQRREREKPSNQSVESSVTEHGEWSRADGWLPTMLLSYCQAAPIVNVRPPPSAPSRQPVDWPVRPTTCAGVVSTLPLLGGSRCWRLARIPPNALSTSATNFRPDRDAVQSGRDDIVICIVRRGGQCTDAEKSEPVVG